VLSSSEQQRQRIEDCAQQDAVARHAEPVAPRQQQVAQQQQLAEQQEKERLVEEVAMQQRQVAIHAAE